MTKITNWGIIGTGKIAQSFAGALHQVPDARLHSVLSRTQASANQFARINNAAFATENGEDFLNDPELEVVYIATPHPMHHRDAIKCLQAGKHVLCEKPLALNLGQVREMIAAAESNGRFLMEAMWTWFLPAIMRAKSLLEDGAIGMPRIISADFGFNFPFDPKHRFFNPELGGGALLDIGIYPLALALYFFGKPETVTGVAVIGKTGVDESMTASLRYADGRVASCLATGRAETPCEAVIAGSKGYLRIHRNFWRSERLTIHRRDRESQELNIPIHGNGYNYELMHTQTCIREGRTQSPVMSWQDSLHLMEIMDQLRRSWSLRYPVEENDER